MADNFDMKKFLAENKLGAYSRLKEEQLNKTLKVGDLKVGDMVKHPDLELQSKVSKVEGDKVEIEGPRGEKIMVPISSVIKLGAEKVLNEISSRETLERIDGLISLRSLKEVYSTVDDIVEDLMKEGFDNNQIADYMSIVIRQYITKPSMGKLGVAQESKKPMKEGEDIFADIEDDLMHGTDSKRDQIEYLQEIISWCQNKIEEIKDTGMDETKKPTEEAISQVTLPKGITLGSDNPEGDKLVLRFLQGIAKKFDYPVAKAAMFVKERLKKLGY